MPNPRTSGRPVRIILRPCVCGTIHLQHGETRIRFAPDEFRAFAAAVNQVIDGLSSKDREGGPYSVESIRCH